MIGGAGGTLGSARVAAARPDGYTLLAGSMGSHVAAPVLTPNVKYDSARDFEPVGLTANAPAVIVARKDFPAAFPDHHPHRRSGSERDSKHCAIPHGQENTMVKLPTPITQVPALLRMPALLLVMWRPPV